MTSSLIHPFTPLKLLAHRERVQRMLRGEVVYPVAVEWDLSNVCPHDCAFCSFGTSESQGYRQQTWVKFPEPRALTLLDELAAVGVQAITWTGGGEPLVHQGAPAIFERSTDRGFAWGVVTNGLGLKGPVARLIADHARFVRVSLDAGCAETHQQTHRTPNLQFHQILDQLLAVRSRAGDRLTIGASFCVMDENWGEIYQAAQLVKQHGGNYLEVRPTFPTDWRGDGWGQALTPAHVDAAKVELAHAQAHLNDDTFQVIGLVARFDQLDAPAKPYTKCQIGPLTTVIGADGRLWHCCVQRGREGFSPGSVLETPFTDVWMTASHRALMDGIDVQRCPRCRYDGYNQVIAEAIDADTMHLNFL